MSTLSATFFLPLPPSVNSYYQYHGHRRYVGKEGQAFKAAVLEAVQGQPVRFGAARLSVSVEIHFRDRRRQDISNRIKALEDALCQAGLFDDDEQVDELIVRRGEIVKGGSCEVEIKVLTD